MRLYYCKYLFVLILLFLFSSHTFCQRSRSVAQDIKVTTYVTDKTGTLTSSQIKDLETKLAAFEKETSNQIVVWMEPSLDGNSVEDRSYEIAEKNGIGQKGKNNGVLLYIAKNDRKLRIEVGYGLEGSLTDALSSQIIRNEITPQFKKGNFYAGINAGVDAIMKATKGEYTADEESTDNDPVAGICCIPFPVLVFLVIFLFIFVIPIFNRIFGGSKGRNRS
ncbi:MAG: TPM domain-containing protein, partial [Ignavibacteria bacterium]|nr:TPM domain-containing protein [Ignavibacteria bacterium]